jgi:hypothetical protein
MLLGDSKAYQKNLPIEVRARIISLPPEALDILFKAT